MNEKTAMLVVSFILGILLVVALVGLGRMVGRAVADIDCHVSQTPCATDSP